MGNKPSNPNDKMGRKRSSKQQNKNKTQHNKQAASHTLSVQDFIRNSSNSSEHKIKNPQLNTEDWLQNVEENVLEMVDNESENKFRFVPKENHVNNLENTVQYVKQLGRGASCRVLLAQHRFSGAIFALKQLRKDDYANMNRFEQEVSILQKLKHENIIRLKAVYVDTFNFYIAVQYCHGGPFLDHILTQKKFSERQAANYLHTIMTAIEYLHSINIVHRDLKPGNIMFDRPPLLRQLNSQRTLTTLTMTNTQSFTRSMHYGMVDQDGYDQSTELYVDSNKPPQIDADNDDNNNENKEDDGAGPSPPPDMGHVTTFTGDDEKKASTLKITANTTSKTKSKEVKFNHAPKGNQLNLHLDVATSGTVSLTANRQSSVYSTTVSTMKDKISSNKISNTGNYNTTTVPINNNNNNNNNNNGKTENKSNKNDKNESKNIDENNGDDEDDDEDEDDDDDDEKHGHNKSLESESGFHHMLDLLGQGDESNMAQVQGQASAGSGDSDDVQDKRARLMIIDFGDAIEIELNDRYNDFVGTPAYIPPEITRPRTGVELKAGDMWSIGIIAFILVCGVPPFYGRNDNETIQKVLKGRLRWPNHVQLSDSCKSFIGWLLRRNPSERMTASQALKHEWIVDKASTESLGNKLISDISDFHQASLVFNLFLSLFISFFFSNYGTKQTPTI